MAVVDVFEAGAGVTQPRASQTVGELAAVALGPLAVDQQGEAVVEVERVDVGGVELFGEGACHAMELHALQLAERWMVEHCG